MAEPAEPAEALLTHAPDPSARALRSARTPLVFGPTPLHPLDRLRRHLGPLTPRLWIKRDDQTGLALGGNKARKLEYLLAQARTEDADVLVTVGAAQSNHARQTAAAAALAGVESVLVLRVPPDSSESYRETGNVLLDRVLGARVVLVEQTAAEPHPERAAAEEIVARLRAEGRRPFLIPSGGSTAVGALGYVEAFAEIAASGVDLDAIVLATGSGGTQAGLLAGRALRERSIRAHGDTAHGRVAIHGVAVAPDADALASTVGTLTAETLGLLGLPAEPAEVHLDDGFVGAGYGAITEEGLEAISLFARVEGILLDPVYTAKAAAALLHGIRSRSFSADADVLFLHTGGAPALFAHAGALNAALG